MGLVLVRYLIPTIFIDTWIWFDTRYSILDTFVVNVISSTYSGATWNDCAMSIYYFSKNSFVMKHSRFFSLKNLIFSPQKSDFFSPKSDFVLENIRNSGFCPCILYTTFRKHTKSGVWSLSEFPCFIVYAARNIPSISDTMWCIAGFILVRRSTQTELRKRICADTRVMDGFILYVA